MPGGGSANPATPDSINDRLHFLKMRGREVFKLAVKVMEQAAQEILEQNGIKPDQLSCLIPHQANLRIIELLSSRLNVPMERFYLNLEKYGNTSASFDPDRTRRGDPVGTHSAWGLHIVGRFWSRPYLGAGAPENSLISARHL